MPGSQVLDVGRTLHIHSGALEKRLCLHRYLTMLISFAAGYLPGMMLPHIKFFGVMSLTYLMVGVAWAALYAKHWKEVFALQHCITAVIALGMMEMSTW